MRHMRRFVLAFILLGFILPVTASPALAAVEGSPDLEALIVGDNQFQVGTTGTLELVIQNKGTFAGRVTGADDQVLAYGYAMGGMMAAYPCTTAQNIAVTLESNNPVVEVVGGSDYVGALARSFVTPEELSFDIRVYRYADVGIYELELKVFYEYTKDVDWLNPPDSLPLAPDPDAYNPATYQPHFDFTFEERTEVIPITVNVVGSYFEAVKTEVDRMRPGSSGTVSVTLGNNGETAYDVTAEVVPSGNFIPVDRASYLGTVNAGARVTTEFKVAVSNDAIAKTSPLTIQVHYRDKQDVERTSTVTAGVEISPDIEFEIVGTEIDGTLAPGNNVELAISLKNTSDVDTNDAVARINATDPFSSTDDTAYIGDLPAGETKVARFRLSADDDAMPKAYGIDVEVKYRDGNGDSYTSESMKATVEVVEKIGLPLETIVLIAVLIIGVGGGGFLGLQAWRRRRRPAATSEHDAATV
ncbi:MAG: hypothetical protein JXA58_05170 [Dehalococcoidia bacterium]|nr:hypothetical protein [Dehalococcoidia bacterium]